MPLRSRLWAALSVALAMILAAGFGVAGPATADPGGTDLAAADESELGAMLGVQYEPQPDGFVRATEYENATVTEFQIAACSISATAYKPVKSGSSVRGSGSVRLSSGCSGTWEVLLHVQIYSMEWIPMKTFRTVTVPPSSGSFSASADCKRGTWRSEIIIQRGSEDAASRSATLGVSSC